MVGCCKELPAGILSPSQLCCLVSAPATLVNRQSLHNAKLQTLQWIQAAWNLWWAITLMQTEFKEISGITRISFSSRVGWSTLIPPRPDLLLPRSPETFSSIYEGYANGWCKLTWWRWVHFNHGRPRFGLNSSDRECSGATSAFDGTSINWTALLLESGHKLCSTPPCRKKTEKLFVATHTMHELRSS